jgi:hypothetical protein
MSIFNFETQEESIENKTINNNSFVIPPKIKKNIELCKKMERFKSVNSEELHYHTTDTHGDLFSLTIALLMSGIARMNGYMFIDIKSEREITSIIETDSPFCCCIPRLTINPDFDGVFTIGGDIIDRGENSMESVILLKTLIQLARKRGINIRWLLGNHELAVLQGDFLLSESIGFNALEGYEKEYFNIMRNIFFDCIEEDILQACFNVNLTKRLVSHSVFTRDCLYKKAPLSVLETAINDYLKKVDVNSNAINNFFCANFLTRGSDGILNGIQRKAIVPQVVGHNNFFDNELEIRDNLIKEYNMIIPTDNSQSGVYRGKEKAISCLYIGDETGKYIRKITSYKDFIENV